MTEQQVAVSMLREAFTASLGREGAAALIDEAIVEVGLPASEYITRDNAMKVCDKLKNRSGLVRIIAGSLAARVVLGGD